MLYNKIKNNNAKINIIMRFDHGINIKKVGLKVVVVVTNSESQLCAIISVYLRLQSYCLKKSNVVQKSFRFKENLHHPR